MVEGRHIGLEGERRIAVGVVEGEVVPTAAVEVEVGSLAEGEVDGCSSGEAAHCSYIAVVVEVRRSLAAEEEEVPIDPGAVRHTAAVDNLVVVEEVGCSLGEVEVPIDFAAVRNLAEVEDLKTNVSGMIRN